MPCCNVVVPYFSDITTGAVRVTSADVADGEACGVGGAGVGRSSCLDRGSAIEASRRDSSVVKGR